VAFHARSVEAVAAFEVADAAFGADAELRRAAVGLAGMRFVAAGDEQPVDFGQGASARVADVCLTTVESIRAARTTKRRPPARGLVAAAITCEQISSITSAPKRRTSLRTVDSSGTRSHSPIRQNRRTCSESETSRTSVS
jgi:hypothetical protein